MQATATKTTLHPFLWHELLTNDVEAAVTFYNDVVGWSTQPYDFPAQEGPDYTLWMAGGAAVGGVMKIDAQTMGDIPPSWLGYVYSSDVDATIRKAKTLGGSVVAEPIDVPTVGRMAGLADPQGAVFWVLTPSSSEPMPEPPAEGSIAWNELFTTDSDAAVEFYTKLFEWDRFDPMDMGNGEMYEMFGENGKMYGGIFNKPPDVPAPPHWLFYIRVADLDAALDRVRRGGGQVLSDPIDIPGGERVAPCLDPQNASFALLGK